MIDDGVPFAPSLTRTPPPLHLSYFMWKKPRLVRINQDRGHQGQLIFQWHTNNLQHKRKCLVVSISAPQSHIGFTAFLKRWRNLCSFKWLNFSLSFVSIFTSIGSYVENNLDFNVEDCINIDLNCLLNLTARMEFPKSAVSNSFYKRNSKSQFYQCSPRIETKQLICADWFSNDWNTDRLINTSAASRT